MGNTSASATGNSAASGYSSTSCVRTATINGGAATRDPANIGATTAVLVVRITISSAIVRAAAGYNGSPANDRTATPNCGTASDCCTASNCGTAASCATPGAAALAPDQHNLSVVLSVLSLIGRNNLVEILWKDRNRRAHCRQDKQDRARKPRKGQLEPQIARCHVFLLSLCSPFVGLMGRKPARVRCPLSVGPACYLLV